MNFLPLMMMMNSMNRGKDQGSMNVDGMIRELNRMKEFENMDKKSDSEKMNAMFSMLGGANPQLGNMKNMMNMMQMMSSMKQGGGGNPLAGMMNGMGGGNPLAGMMSGMGGGNPLAGMMSGMGGGNPLAGMMNGMGGGNPFAAMMNGMGGQGNTAFKQSVPNEPDASPPDRRQHTDEEAGTPLKPVAKIANKEITYILNRYINR